MNREPEADHATRSRSSRRWRWWTTAALCVVALCVLVVLPTLAQSPPDTPTTPPSPRKLLDVLKVEEEGKPTNPLWIFIAITVVITALTTIVNALKRDRILRRTRGKYVVLLHEGSRYTGILRLILKDVEIASEKTDVEGKDAGRLFPETEFQKLYAMLRYHDEMTAKESGERQAYAERLYHPTFLAKILRRLQSLGRQFNTTLKQIYDRAIGQRLRKRFGGFVGGAEITQLAEAQAEEFAGASMATGASYRLLIDRLIGTRVIAKVGGVDYECILADYTLDGFYHLLDVKFHEMSKINVHKDMGTWVGSDKGFRFTRQGDTYTIESRVAYPVTLRHVSYRDGKEIHGVVVGNQERRDINLVIQPYSRVEWPVMFHPDRTREERNVAGGLLDEVRYSIPMHAEYYNTVEMEFETVRTADVIIRYSDNVVQYRAEKFDPQLVSIDTLTEALWHSAARFDFQDKEGTRVRGLHLYRGYITNLSKARVDTVEITSFYSKRWQTEDQFATTDDRLRPIRRTFRGWLPPMKGRLAAAQIALIARLREERRAVSPMSRVLFFPIVRHRREWRAVPVPRQMPIRIGVVSTRPRDEEYLALSERKFILGHRLLFRRLREQRLERLEKLDILWVGYGARVTGGPGLTRANEDRIRKFAANGGIVIALAPNTRAARGNKLSWVPDPLVFGKNPVKQDLNDTRAGEPIFRHPHAIDAKALKPLVWWDDWSDRYTLLATVTSQVRNEEYPAAVALALPYGSGLYVVLGVGPESAADLSWSMPLAENLLHYAIRWKSQHHLTGRSHVA